MAAIKPGLCNIVLKKFDKQMVKKYLESIKRAAMVNQESGDVEINKTRTSNLTQIKMDNQNHNCHDDLLEDEEIFKLVKKKQLEALKEKSKEEKFQPINKRSSK